MIQQASHINSIDTKASAKVNGSKKAETAEQGLGENEFSTELEASLNLNPIVITSDLELQLPTELLKQSGNSNESVSPKVFDSSLTQDVSKLLGPESASVEVNIEGAEGVEVVEGEKIDPKLLQSLLKTPALQTASTGRAPALDFAAAEIDPKLLNMEDFVEQKNAALKKPLTEAYGFKLNNTEKEAAKMGLTETQVVSNVAALADAPVNSQQFILNMMNEQSPSTNVNEVASAPKVFDMNNVKSTNANDLINQISDYVIQAKASKEPTVQMRFNHSELGVVDIQVSKMAGNHEAVAINIGAHSAEGKHFFQQNAKELLSHLASTGHTVSDFKVETPSQTAKSDFDFGSQFGKNQPGQDKQFGSEQNQRRHEQERRADLWKALNQEAA